MGWQRHQLDHMQIICASLQTDIHASTSSLNFFTGRMLFLMPNQQRQITWGNLHLHKYHNFACPRDIENIHKYIVEFSFNDARTLKCPAVLWPY